MIEQGYLLDTNVLTELQKPRPEPRVLGFLNGVAGTFTSLSVLTIGELRRGAQLRRHRNTSDAERLDAWIDNLEADYVGRVLPVSRDVATMWGRLSTDRTRPVVDTLIAATALVHGLILVTRNTRDVSGTGVSLLNPWS